MRFFTFFLFLTILLFNQVIAQTGNELKLQNAIKEYNTLRDEGNQLTNSSPPEQFQDHLSKCRRLLNELDEIASPDSEGMSLVIRYFYMNTRYEIAFNYGKIGKNQDAYDIFKVIEPDMKFFTASQFPLRYKFFEKNYVIEYKNFQPTLYEYYVGYAEVCNNLGKSSEALQQVRNSEATRESSNSSFFRAIALNIGTKLKSRSQELDHEQANYAIALMESYADMADEDRKYFENLKQDLSIKGWEELNAALESATNKGSGADYYSRAIAPLLKFNHQSEAVQAYRKALDAGVSDRSFLYKAADYGVQHDVSLGLAATDRLMISTTKSECYEWDKISALYSRLGNNSKANLAGKNATDCRKAEARQARKADQNFHIYLGTYPFKYMTKAEKMDYSGIVGIMAGKTMINFTLVKVQKKKYNFSDLWIRDLESTSDDWKPTWDGLETDVAFRFTPERFSKDGSYYYFGPRIGYAKKTLSSVVTNVTDAQGNTTSQTLNPVDEQLQFLLELGSIGYGKVLGVDMNVSFGAYYGTFGTGNSAIKLDENSFSNIMLDNETPKHWGPIFRVNFSLGFVL